MLILEVALCLALIYALGALVCSGLHEFVAQLLRLRWKNLDGALSDMLDIADYAKFIAHPLIKDVWDAHRKPTAIPSTIAARAIVHAFETGERVDVNPTNVLSTIPLSLQRQIVPFIHGELSTLDQLYEAAQTWFDASMTAASDLYARQAHWISIVVAFVFAFALNIDTISIGTRLAEDPALRSTIVQVAQDTAQREKASGVDPCGSSDTDPKSRVAACTAALTSVGGDLVGWNLTSWNRMHTTAFFTILVGWLVSALAMSLGARFWFDALSRLVTMRAGLSGAEANKQATQVSQNEAE